MKTVLTRPESAWFNAMIYHLAVDAECIATRWTRCHLLSRFQSHWVLTHRPWAVQHILHCIQQG